MPAPTLDVIGLIARCHAMMHEHRSLLDAHNALIAQIGFLDSERLVMLRELAYHRETSASERRSRPRQTLLLQVPVAVPSILPV